jgi:predicted NBD/HSP70 family sugar kinase
MRIGVDVGGTEIEVALMDSNDDIVFTRRIASPRDDYAAAVGAIINIVEDMENTQGSPILSDSAFPVQFHPQLERSKTPPIRRLTDFVWIKILPPNWDAPFAC